MQMLRKTGAWTMAALALVSGTAGAQQEQSGPQRSVLAGVYTPEQARRGRQVFANVCAECHGGEEFTGTFMQSWVGATVKMLFTEVSTSMPEDNPGGLRPGQYADVLAYIFQLNGLPPGEDELPPRDDVLAKILIERGP